MQFVPTHFFDPSRRLPAAGPCLLQQSRRRLWRHGFLHALTREILLHAEQETLDQFQFSMCGLNVLVFDQTHAGGLNPGGPHDIELAQAQRHPANFQSRKPNHVVCTSRSAVCFSKTDAVVQYVFLIEGNIWQLSGLIASASLNKIELPEMELPEIDLMETGNRLLLPECI